MENAIRVLEESYKNISNRVEDIETKIEQIQNFKNCSSECIKPLLHKSEYLQENHRNLSSDLEEVNKSIERRKNFELLNALKNCQNQVHALSHLTATIETHQDW